jgi:hypothetical protein
MKDERIRPIIDVVVTESVIGSLTYAASPDRVFGPLLP